jgi:aspartyl-tRNA(Asn)/glutamyl-tRNA(Gln) amidotransferase subunit B
LGLSADELQSLVNADAVDVFAETVAAGAPAAEARNWWLGYLAQLANAREVEVTALAISPAQVAKVIELVAAGTLSTALGRQVVDAVLETGADVEQVIAERGLAVVSDTSALTEAADAAIAANPDVAEKVRGGKLPAVGVLVGSVMKATRGQADAATVRAILLDQLGVSDL